MFEQYFYILHYLGSFDTSCIIFKNNKIINIGEKKYRTFKNNLFVEMKISKVINYVTNMYKYLIIDVS
jgi:hypothetical protein